MYDVIIVGSGPAGLVAGLYAGRFRLNVLMLEKMSIGGQIIVSPTIDNFPGFPQGISTIELIDRFKKQIDEVGVPLLMEEVLEVTANPKIKPSSYTLKTLSKSYEAKSVIVASGAYSKKLDVSGEDRLIGRGVSYCGTCDAPFFKDKDIVVVGGGDRALEEAIFLTRYAYKVTIVHRRKHLRASEILEQKARQNAKITFMLDSIIEEIVGAEKVESVKIKNVLTHAESLYPCQGAFIFIGIKPNTRFVRNLLHLNESDFIITDQDMKTSLEGVYACGDCRKKSLYQVVNACGEGAVAADSVHKYLLSLKK